MENYPTVLVYQSFPDKKPITQTTTRKKQNKKNVQTRTWPCRLAARTCWRGIYTPRREIWPTDSLYLSVPSCTLTFQHLSHKHREGCVEALDTDVHPGWFSSNLTKHTSAYLQTSARTTRSSGGHVRAHIWVKHAVCFHGFVRLEGEKRRKKSSFLSPAMTLSSGTGEVKSIRKQREAQARSCVLKELNN